MSLFYEKAHRLKALRSYKMTKKELKKLSRADLIEMLIEQSIELNELKAQHSTAASELENRKIAIDNAGSIAEASLKLTDVFLEAEKAAQIYLQNIQLLSERQEALCSERERECDERVAARITETEQKCKEMEAETEQRCASMLEKARSESQSYWDAVSKKLDEYYDSHKNIREMLGIIQEKAESETGDVE